MGPSRARERQTDKCPITERRVTFPSFYYASRKGGSYFRIQNATRRSDVGRSSYKIPMSYSFAPSPARASPFRLLSKKFYQLPLSKSHISLFDNIFHPEKVSRITTGRLGNWSASANKCVTHSDRHSRVASQVPPTQNI